MSKAISKALLAILALAVVLQCQARASDDSKSQTYVVIVGIDTYKDAQILPRKHAEADAKMLSDVFTNPAHLGVDADHIRLLLGTDDPQRKSQPATKENILNALNWVVDRAAKDDLVIFVYIGEGGAIGERTCYFTTDSSFKDRAKTALNAGEIENVLDKLKSQSFCAFVDVDFHGYKAGQEKVGDPEKIYRELIGKDDDAGPPQDRVVFLPNSGLKPSLDLAQHGIFATVLADGLKGKADRFGYEPDGLITVEELIKYVRKELPELARANGKTDDEKGQQPIILEGQTKNFVIDRNPAITEMSKKRIAEFEKIAKTKNLSKIILEEGRNFLTRMPKLEGQQELRKAYQKLADGQITAEQFAGQRDNIVANMKLTTRAAADYARQIMSATEVVMHNYYKKVTAGQLTDGAIRGMYKYLDEPIPSAVKEKLDNVKDLDKADLIALLTEARQHLGKREDLADGKDVTLSLHPMMNKLDRHSDYIDPDTLARFRIELQGKFSGIGVQIRKNNTRDELQVITPIIGSPAYKAKIYAGDIITHIVREVDTEGTPLPAPEVIPTKGMTTEEAVKKIVGKEGTKVKIIIERDGEPKPLEFNLIRGSVELETVLGHKRNGDDTWDYVIDPENQICYVRLTGFQENTARDLEQMMRKLYKTGIKGFILDLRFNPGGLLDQAVRISDLFIDDGMIVTIKPRSGPETSYVGKSEGSFTSFPMVCLVNGYSASASEIVSACLQDHGRALIVGSRSYGKGSVQTILPFRESGKPAQIKVTTATFWRPSGKNLNKSSTSGKDYEDWGVKPDKGYDLTLTRDELNDLQDQQRDREIIARPGGKTATVNTSFRDRQLDMALNYLRTQIKLANNKGTAKKAGG
jgi:carboxyl-terminal processing protease